MALLAIDIGTLSARAGLLAADGELLSVGIAPFPLLRPAEDQAAYRLDDIWDAMGQAVRGCLGPHAPDVQAVAIDATSSVALSHTGAPPLAGGADVLCWMDHRAEAEADEIAASGDGLLHAYGGGMSPEIHLPKLAWLARRDPAAWARVTGVRDLCDALAHRMTGVDAHSLNGLACKWAYLPGEGWRIGLLDTLGLTRLPALGALSQPPLPVGAVHGVVQATAAVHLGLHPGTPVAIGLIDAEAGMLGGFGAGYAAAMERTLALIGGTSTCIMAMTRSARRIPGVWGPFRDAVLPGTWLHEAGQSLTGAALDLVLRHHPGGPHDVTPRHHAEAAAAITALLDQEGPAFAARRHVVPDWLGNRAPLGNGRVRAVLTGIGEETGTRAFLESYYAAARGIALQVRHVMLHMNRHGYTLDRVCLTGGHRHNPLLVRLYADALPSELALSAHPEPVLLGTAMVAATAAGLHPSLLDAQEAMAWPETIVPPNPHWAAAHDAAYAAYLALFDARAAVDRQAALLERMETP